MSTNNRLSTFSILKTRGDTRVSNYVIEKNTRERQNSAEKNKMTETIKIYDVAHESMQKNIFGNLW